MLVVAAGDDCADLAQTRINGLASDTFYDFQVIAHRSDSSLSSPVVTLNTANVGLSLESVYCVALISARPVHRVNRATSHSHECLQSDVDERSQLGRHGSRRRI